MSTIEQNFEIPGKPVTFHQVKSDHKYPAWKWLLIILPALVFFVLILSFVLFNQSDNSAANKANELNPLTITPTPPAQVPQFLQDTRTGLNSLDLNQSQLSTPQIDLDINFR